MQDAFGRLLRDVLGRDIQPASAPGPWQPLAFFSPDGRCVAGLEVGLLPLIADEQRHLAAGIRSAATDPDWRGRGLFRRLMQTALEWCEAHTTSVTLLYTETPSLYDSFGFRSIPQHAFTGAVRTSSSESTARQLALSSGTDLRLVLDAVARRAPLSARCALLVDPPLVLANIAKDEQLKLLHDSASDALIVYEIDGDQMTIADVVAARMPTFATLMRIMAPKVARIRCLFPPDKLGWDGTPEEIDTGLMLRGPIPQAMRQPFMFPPTSEF